MACFQVANLFARYMYLNSHDGIQQELDVKFGLVLSVSMN